MHAVGAVPLQLSKHVLVESPPVATYPAAMQEYVATLPIFWSLVYSIVMPATAGSNVHYNTAGGQLTSANRVY